MLVATAASARRIQENWKSEARLQLSTYRLLRASQPRIEDLVD